MAYYVSVIKSRGRRYLSVREIYYDEHNKRRFRTVKTFGSLDKALQADPEIIEKLKKEYDWQPGTEKTGAKLKAAVAGVAASVSGTASLKAPVYPAVSLCYGLQPLKIVWDEWLGLKYKMAYLREKEGLRFDVGQAARYLASIKIIRPDSHCGAFELQTAFLGEPLRDVGLRSLYRTLRFVSKYRDELLAHVNRRVTAEFGRDLTLVFYDCTNVYFESPYDDKQRLFRAVLKQMRREAAAQGLTPAAELGTARGWELDNLSSELVDAALDKIAARLPQADCLRMRGNSKEHRTDLPLMEVALVIDSRGIPLDFETFAGNTSEFNTMPVLITALTRKYDIKNVVVVADRGLNSLANLDMLARHGLNFIVAQKLSNLPETVQEQCLNPAAFKSPDTPPADGNATGSGDGSGSDLRYQKLPFEKTGWVKPTKSTDKRRKVTLKGTLLVTYSRSARRRDIAQLEQEILTARQAVRDRRDMRPSFSAGWRSLVSVARTPKDADDNERYTASALKEDVIAARRRRAGFAAVICGGPTFATLPLNDRDVLNSYHRLLKIEDCFRIMKSNFSLRPMFVRSKESINGHITLCVLALIMLRLLEIRLSESGHPLTAAEIGTALKSTVTAHRDTAQDGYFEKTHVLTDVFTLANMRRDPLTGLSGRQAAESKYVVGYAGNRRPIDWILTVTGLQPLPEICNAGVLCQCLKTRASFRGLVGMAATLPRVPATKNGKRG